MKVVDKGVVVCENAGSWLREVVFYVEQFRLASEVW